MGSVQFSQFQSLHGSGHRGDMRDDSAESLFQSFLREAILSSSGMGRDVHTLTLSIQHFLCCPSRGRQIHGYIYEMHVAKTMVVLLVAA